MDTAPWLQRLGFQQYEAAFREHAVDAAVIAALPERSPAGGAIRTIGKVAPPSSPAVPVGERRQVALLFADLAGYTRLSAEHDAEAVHALLSAFFETADSIRRREIVA